MIELKNVNKSFKNGSSTITAVNSLSLELPERGLVVLLGKSGSGKSTLLNIIGGLDDYSGEISYGDGTTVSGYQPFRFDKYRSENIGYVFQNFYIDEDITIVENIRRGLIISGITDKAEQTKRITESLRAVGLLLYKRRLASSLSLGQKQRVAIARAIAIMPKILLADEPTGNLDSENGKAILDILKNLSKQMLVICVTHNESLANDNADIIYHLQDGKIESQEIKREQEALSVSSQPEEETIQEVKSYTADVKDVKVSLMSDESSSDKGEIKIFIKDGKNYIYIPENYQVTKEDMTAEFTALKAKKKEIEKQKSLTQVGSYDTSTFKNEHKSAFITKGFFKNTITKKQRRLTIILSFFIAVALAIGSAVVYNIHEAISSYSDVYNSRYDIAISSEDATDQLSDQDLKAILKDENNGITGLGSAHTGTINSSSATIYGSIGLPDNYTAYRDADSLKDGEIAVDDRFALNYVDFSHKNVNSIRGIKIPLYNQNGELTYYTVKDVYDSDNNLGELIVGGINNKDDLFWFTYFNSALTSFSTIYESDKEIINYRPDSINLFSNLEVIDDPFSATVKVSKSVRDYLLKYQHYFTDYDIPQYDDSTKDTLNISISDLLSSYVDEEGYKIYIPDTFLSKDKDAFLLSLIPEVPFIAEKPSDSIKTSELKTDDIYSTYPEVYINQRFYDLLNSSADDITSSLQNLGYQLVGTFTGSDSLFVFADEDFAIKSLMKGMIREDTNYSILHGTSYYYIFMTENKNKVLSYYEDNPDLEVVDVSSLSTGYNNGMYNIIYGIIIFIIAIELLLYALLFRSKMAFDLKAIGIYRSLGMKRIQIVTHYLISTLTSLTAQFLVPYLVVHALILLVSNFNFITSPLYIFLGALAGYILVFIAVLIPLAALLLKTPHKILTKYDI